LVYTFRTSNADKEVKKMCISRKSNTPAVSFALLAGTAMFASLASADVFDIKYEANFSGYGSVVAEFKVDTDAAGAIEVYVPSFGRTLYGYQRSAMTGFSVDFAGQTFDQDNISAMIPEAGYAADVWFDEPLSDGATPKTWMFLPWSDGYLMFGAAACGYSCYFYDTAEFMTYGGYLPEFERVPLAVTVSVAVDGDAAAKQECEVALGGAVNEGGYCVVTTTATSPYAEILRASGKSGRGWTEMGEDTTTTVKMYDRAGAGWEVEPFFEESETVRQVNACYNPGGKNMGTKGQCGK
jgi:hypothetical protein